ncbi:MAG: BlaI/MecI/CopY family transcriptional regulator [Nanoarchaeota archaeon]|nr:BlaI/MecI/CopY family transcriptional regulator [Nanoarchaeota archaeon]
MRKIDFTCKRVTLQDLVQCNYSLNDSEYEIFAQIIKSRRGLSVKELVEKTQKDRTTVQKILTKLIKRKLLMKRQMNLERGFMFVYFSKNREEIFNEIEQNVENYFKTIKQSLEAWKSK